MMQASGISVVIPLYNKAEFIKKTVDSVLAQSFEDYEIIVVDDGSQDDGVRQVQQLELSNLQLIQQDNSGVSVARNVGIAAARFPLIAFLDADDLWSPHHLQSLWEMYSSFPNAVMFSDNYAEVSDLNQSVETGAVGSNMRKVDAFLARMAYDNVSIHTSAVMARKDALMAVGGFPPGHNRGEDLATWIALSQQGSVVVSDYVGSRYVRLTGGLTSSLVREPDISMQTAQKYALEHQGTELGDAAQEFYNRIALAHAIDALLAGAPDVARVFIACAHCTRLHRRRWWFVSLLSYLPARVGSLLLRLVVRLRS